jgi:hypothetical protein
MMTKKIPLITLKPKHDKKNLVLHKLRPNKKNEELDYLSFRVHFFLLTAKKSYIYIYKEVKRSTMNIIHMKWREV